MKLKNLMNENTDRLSSKNKRQVLEAISNFNAFGESIYSKSNMKEVVRSISELCENDDQKWHEVLLVAKESLKKRISLTTKKGLR